MWEETASASQSVLGTCSANKHLLLFQKDGNRGMRDVRDQMKKQELLKLHVSYYSSFFQGSPGQPGLLGKDGMKGEKVRKSIVHLEAHCDQGRMLLI